MSTDSLIRVEHVYRYYGPLRAVDDISFEVRRGEVLGFLGPNGAGKSTTMQIISGNLAPSAGRVIVNGADILDEPRRAKAGLGYLPDQPPLYREMTVDEYLWYCTRINRIPRGDRRSAIGRVKERCGLGDVGARIIGNLSKGYQQRVGIAQAIVHAPAVVILDEPTVGLDPIQIREIRALIRELGGDHAVILSTHILPEVQAVCDRVQVIHRGRLVFADTIDGLQRNMLMPWLLLAMHAPPATETLAAMADVLAVEDLGEGRMRVQYRPEATGFPERLVAEAVTRGWRLHEITHERRSLEEVFVDLTRTEDPGEAAAA
jgi:ABC-2 type transport system ATP-binding protein